ncbi:hypothetical protein N658DRAFT_487252 [Parathielavia hyrcaniae]|uniref:Uncharacterized protein n=1 Tax=Parathielavia hyrcaniae TaxID=113614 RepID=A0AAN6T0T1_9PEZI|nr:hypothetical protein N658DRAFT_487252 [Parathielavia hyrcaniae]
MQSMFSAGQAAETDPGAATSRILEIDARKVTKPAFRGEAISAAQQANTQLLRLAPPFTSHRHVLKLIEFNNANSSIIIIVPLLHLVNSQRYVGAVYGFARCIVEHRNRQAGARPQLSLADLDGQHRQLLVRAITRILYTELAETTYAQIIDGLPIGDVAWDRRVQFITEHPITADAHEELCPGMLDKAREFRDTFQPDILTFDAQTRLVEMVVIAVHQIAAILFDLNMSVHKDDGITEWAPPKSNRWYWAVFPDGPLPTLFHHRWYDDYDQYPRGVSDMVGDWAEARILGGVVLFERRDPDTQPKADPDAIYFHSDRENRKALLDFLLDDDNDSPSAIPLPILPRPDNRIRVNPEEPILTTGIYRDPWERMDLAPDAGDSRLKDVMNPRDYPTRDDWHKSRHRAFDRKRKIEEVQLWDDD